MQWKGQRWTVPSAFSATGLPTTLKRLSRPEPEHVRLPRSHEGTRSGTIGVRDQPSKSANNGNRASGDLALDQIGHRRDLIRDGRGRHSKHPTRAVGRPTQIVDDADACGSDRGVGLTQPPRPSERVGNDNPDSHTEPRTQRCAQCGGRGIRVFWEEKHGAIRGVACVDTRRGCDDTEPVLHNPSHAARVRPARNDPDRLGGDRILAVFGRHLARFGLRDDFAGDAQDVAACKRKIRLGPSHGIQGVTDDSCQIIARGDLWDAWKRPCADPVHLRVPD
jgi:hypothetical protein